TNLAYMQISKNNYSNQSLSPVNNSNSYINSSGGLGQMSLSAPSSFHERKVLNQTSIMPPIRPPKEVMKLSSPTDVAVDEDNILNQFLNMGFTREQAISALEKYDYDAQNATNYLLDLQ
ncbi:9914_t:CDS:2, partial [Entrophospora sp. SA101]